MRQSKADTEKAKADIRKDGRCCADWKIANIHIGTKISFLSPIAFT
jgi:hypothetical protein